MAVMAFLCVLTVLALSPELVLTYLFFKGLDYWSIDIRAFGNRGCPWNGGGDDNVFYTVYTSSYMPRPSSVFVLFIETVEHIM